VILHRDPASGRGDTPPRKTQTTFDVVGRVICATHLPNGGVQTNTDLLASINVIGRQKAQLDCRSCHLKFSAGELGFRDFGYPHEADYVPGMSEDTHRAKKRQRSFTSDPIAEGREGIGSDSSNGHSQRKRPRTSGSPPCAVEVPSDGSDGHCQRKRPRTSGSPPRATEVPSREPLTPRHRIVIPGMSWFIRARRAAMIDEGEDGGFGEAGSGKAQPQ